MKKSQPERRTNHLASWSTPIHGRNFAGALTALVTMNEAVLNYSLLLTRLIATRILRLPLFHCCVINYR